MRHARSILVLLIVICASCSQLANAGPFLKKVEQDYWDAAKTKPRAVRYYDEDGRQDGEWIVWYRNGTMRSKTSFLHGTAILFEFWYENGQKKMQEPCTDAGLPDGLWIWWGPDGKVLARSYFRMGTGVEYYFDNAGAEKLRVFWVSGVKLKEVPSTRPTTRP